MLVIQQEMPKKEKKNCEQDKRRVLGEKTEEDRGEVLLYMERERERIKMRWC